MGSFGFDFRNTLGTTYTRPTKTGTTICGLVFEGGVVLGADTRSTNGETVADKNWTAADTESLTGLISSSLNLHRMQSGRKSRVKTALTLLKSKLFQYQGHIGAALVLGGVDRDGPHLFTVYPHGSSDALPYAAMGSGSLAAIAVLETGYNECLSEDKAKLLVTRAIMAGILNDLGSGSTVDLCVLSNGGATYLRNFQCGAEREMRSDTLELDVGKACADRTNISTATRIV